MTRPFHSLVDTGTHVSQKRQALSQQIVTVWSELASPTLVLSSTLVPSKIFFHHSLLPSSSSPCTRVTHTHSTIVIQLTAPYSFATIIGEHASSETSSCKFWW